jgi:hypothetical protein
MALDPINIAVLNSTDSVVDEKGRPTGFFLRFLNGAIRSLQNGLNGILAAQAAAAAANAAAATANAAATNANNAVTASKFEMSLVNSFPTGFVAPLISADETGSVTVANHSRQYGDTALNPTVAVTGAVLALAAAADSVVRIYYDQASRAGGAVTYAFTVDPAPPPVQSGNRHSVGAVTVPAVGTQGGGNVLPPGYAIP